MVTVDSIEVDYVVYILTHPPPKRVFQECTGRVSGWLVHRTRRHAVGTTGAVIVQVPYVLIVEDLVIAHNIYSFIRISLINIALYLA